MDEINRGYIRHIDEISARHSANRDPLLKRLKNVVRSMAGHVARFLLLPLLFLYSFSLLLSLLLYKAFTRREMPALHRQGLDYIDQFTSQYPLHLYPLLAKSLEMAFLKEHLERNATETILEIAIGEGSFSKRIFSAEASVIGLDINPFSLVKTKGMSHVKKRVVCDCLNPPISHGGMESLIANNILHHVTDKKSALSHWAQLADHAIFNENTPYWASAWTVPYLLSAIGLSGMASQQARKIEDMSLQHLELESRLDSIVNEFYTVRHRVGYLDTGTFFLCSNFSFFMRCYGPPTPEWLKKLFLGPLRRVALPLTRRIAELLIYFDSQRSRKKDVFISYICRSKLFSAREPSGNFACPDCRSPLKNDRECTSCGRTYDTVDGMLFLLPKGLMHIKTAYDSKLAEKITGEHL